MARVVLHVGAMKSGTTYLQSLLFANQATLAERGVLAPGRSAGEQTHAVMDALGHVGGRAHAGAWDALLDEVRGHDGTSVISMEFLGPAVPEKVDRVLAEFDGFDEVTVVVTARDLNRTLAAMWQETVQNGRSWTFEDYLRGARDWRPRPDRDPEQLTEAGKSFWRQHNLVRICRNWSRGQARLSLVTVPQPGAPRDVLRDRFLGVLGVPTDGLVAPARANESIGAASGEVLRRVNALLDDQGMAFPAGQHLRKRLWSEWRGEAAGHKDDEAKVGLPLEPWVQEYAATMVTRLRGQDLELVGDWDDLTPRAVPGLDPGSVDAVEVSDAAVVWLAGALARQLDV
jgi:hypothetical protein